MVPGVGFEPTHLAASVFETDMSAVPSSGQLMFLQLVAKFDASISSATRRANNASNSIEHPNIAFTYRTASNKLSAKTCDTIPQIRLFARCEFISRSIHAPCYAVSRCLRLPLVIIARGYRVLKSFALPSHPSTFTILCATMSFTA